MCVYIYILRLLGEVGEDKKQRSKCCDYNKPSRPQFCCQKEKIYRTATGATAPIQTQGTAQIHSYFYGNADFDLHTPTPASLSQADFNAVQRSTLESRCLLCNSSKSAKLGRKTSYSDIVEDPCPSLIHWAPMLKFLELPQRA